MLELALDDAKRVFHLSTDAGLKVLKLVEYRPHWAVLVQRYALARAYGQSEAHHAH